MVNLDEFRIPRGIRTLAYLPGLADYLFWRVRGELSAVLIITTTTY